MYKTVIGMEVHIELGTTSKMFCGCAADHFLAEPNTQTCPVCLGLPGALPYANSQAIEDTVKLGLVLGCKIAKESKFDRKHYFYPDLPKSYQISQYDKPFCSGGEFLGVRIRRVHLEEDTAKLVHKDGRSLVDFNRSGVPLVELVTEPDFDEVGKVIEFLQELQIMVRYLGISSADMEKGSMRLEANVSLAQRGDELPDYKVELKNINSFKFLQKALLAEIERQSQALGRSEKLKQETRGYDEKTGKTFLQRAKEEAQDYRYFPEPDIAPVELGGDEIGKWQKELPEMPEVKRKKLRESGLSEEYVLVLVSERARAEYFEECLSLDGAQGVGAKTIAGVMVNQNLDSKYPEPAGLVRHLLGLIKKDYASEEELRRAVKKVLGANKKAVDDYKSGKRQVIGFLVGQVQKELKGQGEPKTIVQVLQRELGRS